MDWKPSLQAGLADRLAYNFDSEENASKWKNLFVDSLRKVQKQVWPTLTAGSGTLEYLESLILQLLRVLCACQPHVVQDVEDRVRKTFPNPIDKWAIADAQAAVERGRKKCDLVLPVDKVHNLLVKEVLAYKIDMQVSLYIVAVLEHIAADILKLTGNYVKYIPRLEIHSQDIMVAMCADNVLMEMFSQDEEGLAVPIEEENVQKRESVNYSEMVRDFMFEENQYIKDLNMIIKVFRQPFLPVISRLGDQDPVFSDIMDIHRLTLSLLSSVEDTIEMTDEAEIPAIGTCFLDIAEAEELDVYVKYAGDVLQTTVREKLSEWLSMCEVQSQLRDGGNTTFELAIKYVLPKLLLGPIYHCLHYFDVIESLIALTDSDEDRVMLKDACTSLRQIKLTLDSICTGVLPKKRPMESSFRFLCHTEKSAACAKMVELQKSIDGWEGRNLSECAKEFVMEGPLQKLAGKKLTDRYVFMFDSLLVLCKHNTRRSSVTGAVGEFRFKEKFSLRRSHIIDREDGDDGSHMFELQIREHGNVVLVAKTAEEKNNWMAALVFLQTRSTLERMLEGQLMEEERKQPPQLPPPNQYIFSEADSDVNIVFEDNTDYLSSPLIRGGTLLKLVERLTYHKYYDPNFVRTFLTTYRAFCSPKELLNLLIVRFRIPEPQVEDMLSEEATEDEKISARDYVKRFRLVYSKPIKFRVLNVMRQWVTKHFYDFERDPQLLTDLQAFLETVRGKDMKKGVDSIIRRLQSRVTTNCPVSDVEKPPIEWHIARYPEDYDLLTLHPVEIARQVTLLEFEMYRAVKTSELVGSVWTKEERSQTSPNLLRMIRHTTTFTFWLERCIIEAENFEERVATLTRALELMLVFQELNNFNGVIAVTSALNSAAVFRLDHTFMEQPAKLLKAFEDAKELNTDHYKKCIEKLRSINPPCVPFLGMYLTNILHTEEGNMDFLPKRGNMINFRKLRKVAEITGEIQQYQDLPYSFSPEPSIRAFIENLDPLEGRTEKELTDYLYEKSMEIEPRHSKAPAKFHRKWDYSLKSPGIKLMNMRTNSRQPNSELKPVSAGSTRLSEDGDPECSSPTSNPTTPNTPASPNRCDSGVFENIGGVFESKSSAPVRAHTNSVSYGSSSTLTATYFGSTSTVSSITTHESNDDEIPPPVPPRSHKPNKNRHSSASMEVPHLMPVPQRRPPPEVPALPPRVPPVPPRRDVSLHGTLPRAYNQSPLRQNRGYTSSTLPRRH